MSTSENITTEFVKKEIDPTFNLDIYLDSRVEAEKAFQQMLSDANTFGQLSVEEYLSILDHADQYKPGYESIGWTKEEVIFEFAVMQSHFLELDTWKFTIGHPKPHQIQIRKSSLDTSIKADRHMQLLNELNVIYTQKNHDYGDSFHKTYIEEGFAMARIRLSDKLERFKSLSKADAAQMVNDESIRDTLMDLANYAIMTVLEMDDEKRGIK